MKIILNVFAILLLLLSSCSHVSFLPGRLEVNNFTHSETQRIIEALKFLDVNGRKGFVFRKVSLGSNTLGVAYNFSFECYVELSPEAMQDYYFIPVFYHEIGHCFGLLHSPNPKDIMYKEVRFLNEYDKLDLDRYFLQLKSCF